jgi:hypothetical protein
MLRALAAKAEPGAEVARRNLRFWAKNTRNLHITWTWNLLTKAEPGAAVARPNLRFWAKTTWNLHITWILGPFQKRSREPYEKSAELLGGRDAPLVL